MVAVVKLAGSASPARPPRSYGHSKIHSSGGNRLDFDSHCSAWSCNSRCAQLDTILFSSGVNLRKRLNSMAPVTPVTIAKGFHKLPLPIAQLSLAAVLKCGQSFRWKAYPLILDAEKDVGLVECPTHEYRFCLRDRVVCLRQTSDALYYRSVCGTEQSKSPSSGQSTEQAETLAWIRDYFQLDIDLEALYDQWATRDPVFYKLKERFAGIRILRQDPFECLIS